MCEFINLLHKKGFHPIVQFARLLLELWFLHQLVFSFLLSLWWFNIWLVDSYFTVVFQPFFWLLAIYILSWLLQIFGFQPKTTAAIHTVYLSVLCTTIFIVQTFTTLGIFIPGRFHSKEIFIHVDFHPLFLCLRDENISW